MTRRSVLVTAGGLVSASVLVALAATGVRAQVQAPPAPAGPQMVMLALVDIEPGRMQDWTALQKDEVVPAQRKGGLLWRDTWVGTVFGNQFQRGIVTPVSTLAQFDSPSPVVKALGQEGASAVLAKLRTFERARQTYLLQRVDGASFGAPTAKPQLAISTRVTVIPGKNAEFEALVKSDFAPALKKAGVTYYVLSRVVYGGDTNLYFSLVPIENFGELAKGHPAERTLGPAGMAAFMKKAGALTTSVERHIIRHATDLSFAPAGS